MDITALKDKVNSKLHELSITTQTHKLKVPKFSVNYDLKGVKIAGQAEKRGTDLKIRLHPAALKEFGDDYINDTVVHEFAHIIQFANFPGSKPHGSEWKSIMTSLGNDPKRCHSMNLAGAIAKQSTGSSVTPTRKTKTHTYKCSCSTHELSTIRHNRAQSGTSYRCTKCRGLITLVK